MDSKEEVKKEEVKKEEPSSTNSMIDRANEAAARQEAANKRHEELIARDEDLASKRILGGGSEAGQEPVKKEESNADYAKKVTQGVDPNE